MTLAHILCIFAIFSTCIALMALDTPTTVARSDVLHVGRVTNLPLPRYVSLKTKKANVRRGPSLTYRIDWVYQLRNMPLQITAEYGHWRRVIDNDGQGGWVHYVLLSGVRTVIVEKDLLALRNKPSETSRVRAKLEQNVIAQLEECQGAWCELNAGGYTGWAHMSALWGIGPEVLVN